MSHRTFGLVAIIAVWTAGLGAAEPSWPFDLKLDVIRRGYDGKTCMTQARVGIVPRDGEPPLLVATMTPLVVTGSDVYLTVHDMYSADGGKTWTRPTPQPNLGRRPAVGGKEPLLEVHFFDLEQDLYGQRLEVEFVAKLRDEQNFDHIDALVEQMKRDAQAARACLAAARRPR